MDLFYWDGVREVRVPDVPWAKVIRDGRELDVDADGWAEWSMDFFKRGESPHDSDENKSAARKR